MERKNKIKIFVAHHKPGYIYKDNIFEPIHVGKKNSKYDLGILGDDTGDNISYKNHLYAELTAHYWVWKNYDLSNVDYVGFCHYRRYYTYYYKHKFKDIFSTNNIDSLFGKIYHIFGSILFFGRTAIQKKFEEVDFKANSKSIQNFIDKNHYDAYLYKRVPMNGQRTGIHPLKNLQIKQNHFWKICKKTLLNLYPEYKKALDKVQRKFLFNGCNMYIMKKELFIEYSQWLFDYFQVLEDEVKNHNIDLLKEERDSRFYGYYSERLLNLFVEHKKITENISISYDANILMLN